MAQFWSGKNPPVYREHVLYILYNRLTLYKTMANLKAEQLLGSSGMYILYQKIYGHLKVSICL